MSQAFHAIYENGVLRPLAPLSLPESAEVTGTLQEMKSATAAATSDPILGFMADESTLLDEIVEEAYVARESQPFRTEA